jgi:hypothetical protein
MSDTKEDIMAFLEAAVISRPIISAHRLDDIRTVAGNNGDHQMVIDGLAAGNCKLVTVTTRILQCESLSVQFR